MTAKKAAKAVRARTVASKGGKAVKESKQSTVARSARTGRIVSKKHAKANPDTTVVERYSSQEDQPISDDPIERIIKRALKPMKIPAKMGAVADDLYNTRAQRLALSKVVDKLAEHESDLKNYVIDNLPKSDATGSAGKVARVQVKTVDVPRTGDWKKLYKHLKKTGQFELLNRALNKKAVMERWENGKEVPGVDHFTEVKVSVTKV